MLELLRFWHSFWNQFATAEPAEKVPAGTGFPYITYPFVRLAWGERTIIGINIYDQSTSFEGLRGIGEAISKAIPQGGVTHTLSDGSGSITLYRGNPFIQSRSLPPEETAENIKADYVNIEVLAYIL